MKAGIETTLGRVSLRMASSLEAGKGEVLAEISRGLVTELEAAMARTPTSVDSSPTRSSVRVEISPKRRAS